MESKGMRQVRTVRDLPNPTRRVTQAQLVAELARNEHEKARLERELGIWAANHETTARRLKQVLDRIAALWARLDTKRPSGRTPARRRQSRPPVARPRVMPLEY